MKVFSRYLDIRILAKVATENLLAVFPEIDGVESLGGDMSREAMEFLKAWKQVADQPGFDAIACSMPTYCFADALAIGVDILKGNKKVGVDIPRDTILQVYSITSETLDQYVREDLADSFWANTKMDEATLQRIYGLKKREILPLACTIMVIVALSIIEICSDNIIKHLLANLPQPLIFVHILTLTV